MTVARHFVRQVASLALWNACLAACVSAAEIKDLPATAVAPPDAVQTFLGSHCLSCHEGPKADGGLGIVTLRFDPEHPQVRCREPEMLEIRPGDVTEPDFATAMAVLAGG